MGAAIIDIGRPGLARTGLAVHRRITSGATPPHRTAAAVREPWTARGPVEPDAVTMVTVAEAIIHDVGVLGDDDGVGAAVTAGTRERRRGHSCGRAHVWLAGDRMGRGWGGRRGTRAGGGQVAATRAALAAGISCIRQLRVIVDPGGCTGLA